MKDLSEHLTDIVQNSTRAKATLVEIWFRFSEHELELGIRDNGKGIPPDILPTVTDPFTTTRTTRKVGLGLPLLRQNAEQTGGSLSLQSTLGQGTEIVARFRTAHWDMLPMGDLPAAVVMLAGGNPNTDFVFHYEKPPMEAFVFDTREIRQILDGAPLSNLSVMKMLKELVTNNLAEVDAQ